MIYKNIPEDLLSHNNWVNWKFIKTDGRTTKVPFMPDGTPAKSNDPHTWRSYKACVGAKGVDGIGFVFSKTNNIMGVDLDHCRDKESGDLDSWAQDIVNTLHSYTEISPSGTGVHILLRAENLTDLHRKKKEWIEGEVKKGIEMYSDNRYFTMTGNHLAGTPKAVEERNTELARMGKKYGLLKTPTRPPEPIQQKIFSHSDEDIMQRLLFNPKYSKLFHGNWKAYPSPSEADFALCCGLANNTSDPEQIERLFSRSGLAGEKWKRKDYRDRTITEALRKTSSNKLTESPSEKFSRIVSQGGSMTEIMSKGVPEINWKIPELLSEQGIMFIFGASGTGKSFSAMQLAVAMAGGNERYWLAYHKVPELKVLYLDGEMGLKPFFHNFSKLTNGMKKELFKNIFYYPSSILSLDTIEGRNILCKLCALHEPDIVILDTIRCFISGGEDKPENFKQFIETIDYISHKHGVAWVALQHMSKTSVKRRGALTLEDIYGSIAQGGWLDSAVGLKKTSNTKIDVFHVKTRLSKGVPDYTVKVVGDEDEYRYTYDAQKTEVGGIQQKCYDDLFDYVLSKIGECDSHDALFVGTDDFAKVREKGEYTTTTISEMKKKLVEKGFLIQDRKNKRKFEVIKDRFVVDN